MKRVMRFIPKRLRHTLFRKSVSVDFQNSNDVVFKIAETLEELEQAFKLVYQVHLQKKLVALNSSEMKLSKIHALPTTKVLIAVKNNEVVSVLCLSLESQLRTACEEHFDLSSLKVQNKCFIEVSNFVYDPHAVEDFKSYLFPLCKLGLELNKSFFKADYLVTALAAEDFDYWHSLFFLDKISEKSVRYQDFHSKPAVCVFADVKKLEDKFFMRYGRRKARNNLHQYLFVSSDSRLRVPQMHEIVPHKYSPKILDFFFNIKTNIFAHLTSFETRTLHKIYDEPEYAEVLPSIGFRTKFENHRNAKRYHAHLTGQIKREHSEVAAVPITIKTVSLGGVGAICEQKLSAELTYRLNVDIGEKVHIDLLVSPVWSSRDQTYGFIIRNESPAWLSFIESFYKEEKQAS